LTPLTTLRALCVVLLASPAVRVVASEPSGDGGNGDGGDAVEDRRPPLDDPVPGPGLALSRGPGQLPLHIPLAEELGFDVILNVAVLGDTKVGEVVLSAGVEPYLPGLPAAGDAIDDDLEVGWIRSQAKGSYITYDLDHQIEMRALPQTWPRVIYRDTQEGRRTASASSSSVSARGLPPPSTAPTRTARVASAASTSSKARGLLVRTITARSASAPRIACGETRARARFPRERSTC
jgi:hypothetical protein